MNDGEVARKEEIEDLYKKLSDEAESSGYHLNPDFDLTSDLLEGLLTNEKRYGYRACPCRIASGTKEDDLDIICPCDYRDPDLDEYDMCYCALYVSERVLKGEREVCPIPERRPSPEERAEMSTVKEDTSDFTGFKIPVFRCKVCGYLCARDSPPEICPICKSSRDRFERFA